MLRACVFCLALLPFSAQAETPQAPIEDVIRHQIEAFRADDFATAFTFASPTIHGIFGTPEAFGAMVKQGYPMVWHPADVQMQDLRFVAGAWWQRVRVTDGAGQAYLLDYQMIPGPDGWLINAVQLQRANDIGA